MPEYSNPKPKEGINYTKEHPLKEFSQLLIGVAVLTVAVVVSLNFLAGYFVRYIPFEFEKKMVADVAFLKVEENPQQQYLQELADRLSAHMALPQGMSVTVHYSNTDTVNAFATVGGNLFFFQGLINELESEDALATVMAHEIAHIKHRHPIVALGKGVTLAALMAFVSGASGSQAGDWLIGSSVDLGLLKFSRDQESESDASAARALAAEYGHIGGAKELFELFEGIEADIHDEKKSVLKEMFRSHPYSNERWQAIKVLAMEQGWSNSGVSPKLEFPTAEQEMTPATDEFLF